MDTRQAQAVTRELDGVLLVFRACEGLWMIDRVDEPANERGDEDWIESPDGSLDEGATDDETGEIPGRWGFEGATAVAFDEIWGMTEAERRSYHARQLRKLGLPDRGRPARLIWSMIEDFDHFKP